MQFPVLQGDSTVAVHDRIGQAGGAGGGQHAQRVIERDLRKGEFAVVRGQVLPRQVADRRRAGRAMRAMSRTGLVG
jgi:hypothetical protein